ncbi:hypothetical protein [Nocardia sp. NPDC005998]|uniref:oxidoreductase n=1 Tax=Nocardia sp. NPDC005998 TaxID=3156894 RepID=UPI0033B96DA4
MTNELLSQPTELGKVALEHRLAMAPMTRRRATLDGVPTSMNTEYNRQRAAIELIIAEATQPALQGRASRRDPALARTHNRVSAFPIGRTQLARCRKKDGRIPHGARPDSFSSAGFTRRYVAHLPNWTGSVLEHGPRRSRVPSNGARTNTRRLQASFLLYEVHII